LQLKPFFDETSIFPIVRWTGHHSATTGKYCGRASGTFPRSKDIPPAASIEAIFTTSRFPVNVQAQAARKHCDKKDQKPESVDINPANQLTVENRE
jgi:hypothetical protein